MTTTDPRKTAPYGPNGSLQSYPSDAYVPRPDGSGYDRLPVDWRPIEPFVARLQVVGFERGRSAARLIWADEEGRTYPMFMHDIAATLGVISMLRGRTTPLRWVVVKRGANYGIKLADDEQVETSAVAA